MIAINRTPLGNLRAPAAARATMDVGPARPRVARHRRSPDDRPDPSLRRFAMTAVTSACCYATASPGSRVAAGLGRPSGRRGLHGSAAAAARARHPVAGRQPDHVRRLAGRCHRLIPGTRASGAGPSWSAGCRWAAPSPCGWPSCIPDAMAGIVLVNPSVLTLRKDAGSCCRCCACAARRIPGIIGDIAKPGVAEPGYRYMPGEGDVLAVAGLAGRPRRPAEGHRAGAAAAFAGRPRRRTGQFRAWSGMASPPPTSPTSAGAQLPRRHAWTTTRELIFSSSVEFIEQVTAGLP